MLKITGPAVRRKQYVRVPMTDGAGNVTAILRDSNVTYRPLGGSEDERSARALVIAAETGGDLDCYLLKDGYTVWFVRHDYKDAA